MPRWPMADQTFRLPDLGEGLTEAQLVAWRVEEGAQVEVNAPLCDVEAAKAFVVIPSPGAGTGQQLHGRPGESVAVGAPLVTITAAEGAPTEVTPGTLVGYGPGAGPEAGIRRRAPMPTPRSSSRTEGRAAPLVLLLGKGEGVELPLGSRAGP